MAKLSFLTLLALLHLHCSLQSRILPSDNPHYNLLDVSASIQQALNALSSQTPLQQNDVETTTTPFFSNSSSFSVPLYPRETIEPENHESYESLVLSRLQRDQARVLSINSKLGFQLETQDLSTPVASGTSQGSGEYFSTIGIGTPSKTAHLAIDTGSDVSWIQCKPCTDCYQQTDPIYDPSASSTYQPLSCSASACLALDKPSCNAEVCQYQVSYGDGSFTTGDLIADTVSLGSTGTIPKLAIGCGHDNEGLFVGSAGLFGLGGGALSFPSQIKAKSFSYCLPDRNSKTTSTLDFNSARPGDSITTQLTKNTKIDTFFYIGVTGLTVGGKSVQIPPSLFQLDSSTGSGGIIVDSGTAITRLRSEAYTALRDSFRALTTDLPYAGAVSLFDTCYDLSSKTSVRVPTVGFAFGGGKTLSLPAKNYLIPVDSSGTFCFAFAGTRSALSIIGNVQQQGIRVSYDLANDVVGFSPAKC